MLRKLIRRASLLILVGSAAQANSASSQVSPTGGTAPSKLRVVAFSGSTRSASCNSGLVRYVASTAPQCAPDLDITVLDVSRWPLFNDDTISSSNIPPEVLDGIRLVASSDAVIISTPEYNYGMAPATTNAVAWLSKPIEEGATKAPLVGKPCGLLSAGGGLGGTRAQLQARSSFTVFLDMPTMAKPEVAVRIFADPKPFDMNSGELIGEHEQQKVDTWLAAFEAWVARLRVV